MEIRKLPALEVNLDAIRTNAEVLTGLCAQYGIDVAGVVKFSDCDPEVAKAYAAGGCAQLAVSRAKHLKILKEACPEKETLLTRGPARSDIEDTAKYADCLCVHITFQAFRKPERRFFITFSERCHTSVILRVNSISQGGMYMTDHQMPHKLQAE